MIITKKKTYSLIITFLLLISLLSIVANAGGITSQDIDITLVNQEPDPVEPGKIVVVKFKVENNGARQTKELTVFIKPEFPFILPTGETFEREIGSLEGSQYGTKSQIIEWELFIDKDSPEGDNYLTVYYTEKGSDVERKFKDVFAISVRTSDNALQVQEIKTEPETLKPGKEAKLKIVIKNLADSSIKDVTVSLALDGTGITTLNSIDEQILQKMKSGEIAEFEFNIIPDADATIAIHKIPLNIEFQDNINNVNTLNTSFGLKISSPIEYLVYVDSTDIKQEQKKGEVSIKISNAGVNNIKFLTVELLPSNQYEIISAPQIYVGKVDSDDYEDVSYDIYVNKADSQGIVNLKLHLNFKDNLNYEYSEEQTIPLKLFSEENAKKYGLAEEKNGKGLWITALIVLVGGGIYWQLKKRKSKSRKK